MTLPIPIGVSDFKKLIEYEDSRGQKYLFTDKTQFIREVYNDGSEVVVIMRPRRFGKTLNLSMLYYFFALELDGEATKHLFNGLEISKDNDFVSKHQGKYPVIYITLKDIRQTNAAEAKDEVKLILSSLYAEHRYLLETGVLHKEEIARFKAIINEEANDNSLVHAIRFLSEYLYKYHKVKPILLIDEYDTPIQEAYLHGYYDDFIIFMRRLFGSGLKDNKWLTKAIVTGITRIAKGDLFSGVNNTNIYTFMRSKYGESFGFTETEVHELFNKSGISYNKDVISLWYNGYKCGDSTLYNPWSILKCIEEDGKPGPYWINTSSNELIRRLVLKSTSDIRDKLKILLQNKEIEETIDEHIELNNIFTSSSAVWSMLFMAGYLKILSSKKAVFGGRKSVLKVPNMEILGMFKKMVVDWLSSTRGIAWYESFLQDLISGNIYEFTEKLRSLLKQSASYHDVGVKTQESFYHGILLGLIVGLGDQYIIKSNRESGRGRYDLMIAPKKDTVNRVGIIMELKVALEDEDIAFIAEQALQQIDTKKYITELQDFSIDKSIKLGIAFRAQDLECSYKTS